MSQSTGGDSPERTAADPRVQALAAGAGGGGAKYKTMSPARLPITREPCLTIPPGFSPSSLLESPVLLTNMKVEPSPTTGTMRMMSSSFMGKMVKSEKLPSPKEISRNNNISHDDNTGSAEFEFKPHPNSSMHSMASFFQIQNQTQIQTQNQMQNQTPISSSNLNKMENTPPLVSSSNEISLAEVPPQDESHVNGSDLNESSPVVDKTTEDGYNWRKYGQKLVKGSENPRSYYKCTHPNCEVKKQLERSIDGQITEVIYKGHHNHPKPLPNRRLGVGASVLPPTGDDKFEGFLSPEDKGHNNGNQNGMGDINMTPGSTSDEDADVAVGHGGDDVAEEEDPESKRRKMEAVALDTSALGKPNREPRVVVQTVSEVDILDDGYRWRKYGQKVVKGNPNPRSYYKCTHIGCPVRKHVERASHDPKSVITTYEGKHNHDVPTGRNGSGSEPVMKPMVRPCVGAGNGNGPVSLDLGVGIVNNNINNNNNNNRGSVMQYGYGMVQAVQGGEKDEGFSFKTGASLCYNGPGNMVLGP